MSNRTNNDEDIEILDAPDVLDVNDEVPVRSRDREDLAFLIGLTYQKITIKKTLVRSIISAGIASEDGQVRSLVMALGAVVADPRAKPKFSKFYWIDEVTDENIVFFVSHPILDEFGSRLKSADNKATLWLGTKLVSIAESIVVQRSNQQQESQ